MWWGVFPTEALPVWGKSCSRSPAACAKAKPKLKFPHSHGHQGLLAMEMSVVLVQHCSLAGHGTYEREPM